MVSLWNWMLSLNYGLIGVWQQFRLSYNRRLSGQDIFHIPLPQRPALIDPRLLVIFHL